jgi:RNA polymerase sigma-70 factor (ECF subfamily)
VNELEAHRRRLFGLAYRMLGSAAEAEDAVQEALLRYHRDRERVEAPAPWLDAVTARICLDHLKSARREEYLGPWLPEPVRSEELGDGAALSFAALLVLQTLGPRERAAYLLHAIFGYSHAEVAAILGLREEACRQMAHRARRRLEEGRPRFEPTREQRERLLAAFIAACAGGRLEELQQLLAEDVVAVTDGGGKVNAARRPIHGPSAVGRFFLGVLRKSPADTSVEPADLNGGPALLLRREGRASGALLIDGEDLVRAVHLITNPDKLGRL